VVVGDVPFGDYPVHDPAMKHHLTRSIHDYFFAKSLEKVRPGRVMALITSRYTMDKQDDTVRRYLGEHADLLGAIRLWYPRAMRTMQPSRTSGKSGSRQRCTSTARNRCWTIQRMSDAYKA
jgi:hypothetical protein